MADRVKEIAAEEAKNIKTQTKVALRSGAYLYPLRGIVYFFGHKSLWKPLQSRLASTLTAGIGITTGMFVFTYLPQAAILAFTQGPLAAISAALLVMSESSTLLTLFSKTFLIDEALVDTFDGTLVAEDTTSLVSSGRQIKAGNDPVAKLGKMIKKPFAKFSPNGLIRYLMYLPLNFIPVVGTILFLIAQGKKNGPAAHTRYYQLKEWNSSQREKHVEEYKAAYTSFGVAATLLEMVPVASIFFSFTNTVGAALWAADMEKGNVDEHGTSPKLRDTAKKAE